MEKKVLMWVVSLFVCFVFIGGPVQAKITTGDITGGKKAPHVNIAIFHKLHGANDFVYPDFVDDAEILKAMSGKAQLISVSHTAGLKDGDVVTISNDILREASGGFEGFGVDCQLTISIKNKNVTLTGLCQLLMVDQNHREIEHKGVIKPFKMNAAKAWTLIYYNDEDGIAVYADEEFGLE